MTTKHYLAALTALLVALIGFLTWSKPEASTRGVDSALDAPSSEEPQEDAELADSIAADQARRQAPAQVEAAGIDGPGLSPAEGAAPAQDDAARSIELRVIVKTPFGEPLAGQTIRQMSFGTPLGPVPGAPPSAQQGAVQERDIGVSGPDGELVLDVAPTRSHFKVQSSEVATLVEGMMSNVTQEQCTVVIVAGPVRALNGLVTDEEGTPIPGATVTHICIEDFSASFGIPVAMKTQHLASVQSDESGRFEFPLPVESPGTRVKAEAQGFEHQLADAPSRGDSSLTIVLPLARQGETMLYGRVVCSDGSSSVGATVACGEASFATTVTEESGVFYLPVQGGESMVQAVLPGLLPAKYEHVEGTPWPAEILLTLGEKALEISGVVVDEAGKQLEGIHVGVIDGAIFGAVPEPDGEQYGMRRLEDMAARSGEAKCTTDKEGAFRIDGLLARTYQLLAREHETLRAAKSDPIQAGQTGVRIVLDRSAPSGPIAGRVTDSAGAPLPGIQLRGSRAFGIEGNHNASANRVPSPTATTDEEGRFRISESAYDDISIVSYGGIAFASYRAPLADFEDPLDLEIVMESNSSFSIQWSAGRPPEGAYMMRMVDLDGDPIMLFRDYEGGIVSMPEHFLGGPATPVHFVRKGSYEVVLLGAEGEVERFPVVLEGKAQQTIVH